MNRPMLHLTAGQRMALYLFVGVTGTILGVWGI